MSDDHILVIGGRTPGIGAEVIDQITQRYPTAHIKAPTADILDVRSGESVIEYMATEGPFTHIVYAAGVNQLQWIQNLQNGDLEETFGVNAFGFVRALSVHADLHGKRALKSVVAITSDAAHNPMRGSLTYCSSKAAVEMMIKVAAREWAPHTRVNGVAPAMVEDTPMTTYIDAVVPKFRGWTPEKARAYENTQLQMGRRVTKQEVADTVLFVLFGPEYITGTIVDVSGGK